MQKLIGRLTWIASDFARVPGLSWLVGLSLGWCVGVLAWGADRTPQLAAILPVLIALSASRTQAFCIGFAYIFAAGRTIPAFASVWFSNDMMGWYLTTAFSVLGGVGWGALGWSSKADKWRKMAAIGVGWIITLFPPLAAVLPGHIVIAWGFITPGWGWFGVGLSVVAPCVMTWELLRLPKPRAYGVVLAVALVLMAGSTQYREEQTKVAGDMVGVNTKWGAIQNLDEAIQRIEKVGRMIGRVSSEKLASVMVFPEAIIGQYDPILNTVLDVEIRGRAANANMAVVLGADMPDGNGHFETTAIAFYPDKTMGFATARQVVPFALWRPWQKSGYFLSDWTANNILTLKSGVKARVIFCYEEYIPILSLIDEATKDHQLVVVMSNTWADTRRLNSVIQARHSNGIAILFGRHLIRAENQPTEALQQRVGP